MANFTEADYCETCAIIGGYCGHCSGAHWGYMNQFLQPENQFKFETAQGEKG